MQYATARVGRDPRQRQPGLPHARARLRAAPVRDAGCSSAPTRFKTSDYARDGRRGARRPAPALRARRVHRLRRDWDVAGRRRRPTRRARRARRRRSPSTTRSTSSTRAARPGSPKGATLTHHNILNNGFFVGELLRLHRGRPGLPAGALLPLLRHGHGQPRRARRTAPAWSSRRRLRPRRDAARGARRSACTSLYGVPTMFIAMLGRPGLRRVRPQLAAHRDHGRLAVPGRGHEARRRATCTWSEVSICYGMTETSPVSTQTRMDDPLERRVGTVGRVAPARRGAGRRPRDRPASSSAARRASCARAATA